MNPRVEALAFRIWQYGHPREWNCTASEIADHLRVGPQVVGTICARKRWPIRTRQIAEPRNNWNSHSFMVGEDGQSLMTRLRRLSDEAPE